MSDKNLSLEQQIPYLPAPVVYTPLQFGSSATGTGKGVRICCIDSGQPDHKSLLHCIIDQINFSTSDDEKDTIGHSTFVSGIIAADDKNNIIGLAPAVSMYYAKMINDAGEIKFDAFVAGILWGIIKEVDIILILMSSELNHSFLQDAIEKAVQSNICVIAVKNKEKEYPADYKDVMSIGKLGTINTVSSSPLYSTYNEQQYISGSGSSLSCSIVCGIMALVIEKLKSDGKKYTVQDVYSAVVESFSAQNVKE